MMNKFNDIAPGTFSILTDIVVVCPKCQKAGIVHFDKERNVAVFQCEEWVKPDRDKNRYVLAGA